MDKKTNNTNDVHIEQINPREELNELEKTAILQFKLEQESQKDLSKTQQIKVLNDKKNKKKVEFEMELPLSKKTSNDLELPKMKSTSSYNKSLEFEMPKKVNNLSDTIKIKLSDLRVAIDKREQELAKAVEVKKKVSLYDTIVIKLDDIINNRKALKRFDYQKVVDIDEPLYIQSITKKFRRVKDITKSNSFNINVDSEEFIKQIKNLNIIALNKLASRKDNFVRKSKDHKNYYNFEGEKIPKEDYLVCKEQLIEFAVDKLYYQ